MNATDMKNRETSARETAAFLAEKPDRYFAYVKDRIITTWTGQRLGKINWRGLPYKSNFGDKRESINVLADNGITYHGVYYVGAGNYCRLKKKKH